MFTSVAKLSQQRFLIRQPSLTAATLRATTTILPLRPYSQPASLQDSTNLTWSNFFKLRKQQRRINVGSSLFTGLLGCNISWAYLSTMEIDPTQLLFGFDPLTVISAGIIVSGTLGYLLGPIVGSQVFKLAHNRQLTQFNDKNKEFLKHIINNRVDASSQSFSNPVPDYYGEKIGSLKEYKQWLRDCHAYAKKAKEFL
ncbi:hypothetical protein SMKI_11G2700 [Saccharomyces mikatae IFO 1815]|uniref:Presequence translocated-associated motor subunit PAM17 n=1 Tax=Saccharomyces mikatae IFO 1815 TaxID=226126 RepID=A0AA35IRZ8_SACMI|nr:uncharacterized protein SMKI_11G2700 [Saccharomyces mikatae IFO 1815]CAI4034819.1 hypothetical protein SMKI_11G2700 [Saccharomyces mikatae IFO 1815]